MNHTPCRNRLLFNPLFRALWIGMIASSLSTWLSVDGAGTALSAATATPLLLAAVRMSTSLPMCLLALLSVVVSLYGHRHGHHQFAFRKMDLSTFAVSILTFLGFAGPWFMLCAAFILGLCAAIAVLSLQPVLLELLSNAGLPKGLAFGALDMNLGRIACNLASGVLATVIGPAAIFILGAISFCAVFIAGRTTPAQADGKARPLAA
jgi:MFS family permease